MSIGDADGHLLLLSAEAAKQRARNNSF